MKFPSRSRVRPEALLEGLTTAVISLDQELRVSGLNAACESLFGVSRRIAEAQPIALAPKREDTVRAFKELLSGQYDDLPEQAFYMVGTIDQAVEKARKMAA